jgi:hypothetical protein
VFELALNELYQCWMTDREETMLEATLSTMERVLCWTFSTQGGNKSAFYMPSYDNKTPAFPPLWAPVLLRPDTLDVVFQVVGETLEEEQLATLARLCVIQLCGLHGRLFTDERTRHIYMDSVILKVSDLIQQYFTVS